MRHPDENENPEWDGDALVFFGELVIAVGHHFLQDDDESECVADEEQENDAEKGVYLALFLGFHAHEALLVWDKKNRQNFDFMNNSV